MGRMFPRITSVRYVQDYVLELTFADGVVARIDFRRKVVGRGGLFQALEDARYFQQVKVDAEAGTIVWPNELDLDPDVLYSEATGSQVRTVEPAAR